MVDVALRKKLYRITPTLHDYPWGSTSLIAQLQRRKIPTHSPEAELWYGAHPNSPSHIEAVDTDTDAHNLLDLIDSAPQLHLGENVYERFGKLPFLLKILAAQQPLSIQAHPTKEQAEEGFAKENSRGIGMSEFHRNYKDNNHKPELIVALTDFYALAGFKAEQEITELFSQAGVELPQVSSDQNFYQVVLTHLLSLDEAGKEKAIAQVTQLAQRLAESTEQKDQLTAHIVCSVLESFPNDVGVLCSLMLNPIKLTPGESMFLDAGHLHAYVSGMGVEIMANSDNVLRGGLTSKHIDVQELLSVVNFSHLPREESDTQIAHATGEQNVRVSFPADTAEFALSRIRIPAGGLHASAKEEATVSGPSIILCTAGAVNVSASDGTSISLTPTEALWIPSMQSVEIDCSEDTTSEADVFIATVNSEEEK